ncbi:serine/threonine-protein kinase [Frankia canadensis]|uniref:serine/threonine-protein kinase n=1 Tax=Frankia canadensis TaxID=1836972 RepID=UPI001401EFCA|nr:serine/threonine-protein kinase [Frankia canadensis]
MAAALPGYKLGHPMGAGAYGMVITARHRKLKRDVAIKMLASESSAESGFAAEAEVLASFDHPHIVKVHDYVEDDGIGLIVMELLTGGTLSRRRKDLTQQQACAVGLAVAAALAHAHAKGVLHRDIKMDNVIFDGDGCPKVADFGISRAFTGTGVSATGQAGTPMYMAPEQITGGRLGPATDIYALGVLLYRLLSGRPPFESADSVPLVWQRTLTVTPPSPPGVAETVAAVVMRALAKAPADRQPDAETFAHELAAAAVSAFGADWLAGTGIPVYLSDDVRAVAAPHQADPPADDEEAPRRRGSAADLPARASWWIAAAATAVVALVVGLLLVNPFDHGHASGGTPTQATLSASATSPPSDRTPRVGVPTSATAPGGRGHYDASVRDAYLSSCLDVSNNNDGYCTCTLDKLEATYTQEQYQQLSANVQSDSSQRIVREIYAACRDKR